MLSFPIISLKCKQKFAVFDRILCSVERFEFFILNFYSDQSLRLSLFHQLSCQHSEFNLMSIFSSPRNSFHSGKEFFHPFSFRYFINKIPAIRSECVHTHFTVDQGGKKRKILEITFDCDAVFCVYFCDCLFALQFHRIFRSVCLWSHRHGQHGHMNWNFHKHFIWNSPCYLCILCVAVPFAKYSCQK